MIRVLSWFMIVLLLAPIEAYPQDSGEAPHAPKFKKEELAQMLAPIALYPDDLVSQILMATTYPIEIVQADRWVQQHKDLKGDALAKALEKESWDPSVKSLVNFPSVLSALSQKLDITTKIGDAFLVQQKDVMDTIQELRKKAYDAGNLKTTKEQTVEVEKETIIIQPSNPEVIYVPSYSPTVVYGVWMYPAFPPYYYYPPPPPVYPAYHFAVGVAIGVAWGYAWGHCNWHGGNVNINVNRNVNVNPNIDRSKYQQRMQDRGQIGQDGRGSWQHDPAHRKGAAYKDTATAQRFGESRSRSGQARPDTRGYADRGGMDGQMGAKDAQGARGRDSAFSDSGNGNRARMESSRGSSSRSMSSSSRGGGGGFGGGARSGGGRGGGRR